MTFSPAARRAQRAVHAVLLSGALVIGVAGPAVADPSSTDVRRQKQHAAQLARQARQQAARVAATRRSVLAATVAANAALDRYVQARDRAASARDDAEHAADLVTAARERVAGAHARLNDYAAQAYMAGPAAAQLGTVFALVDGDPTRFAANALMLGHVGDAQSQVLDDLRVAEHEERAAATHAAQTAAVAAAAAHGAAAARQHADSVVSAQRRQLAGLERLLARTRGAARSAAKRAAAMEHAYRLALKRARAAAARSSRRGAQCRGGNLDGYPNGRLPMAALCPLWGSPGNVLRKNAAQAFNRMSHEYVKEFGTLLCVNNAYRTYAEQVAMKRSRGSFAATPGQSNHGWGKAADLCGGIQTDGTPQNIWMRLHAPQYGWFHPSWADPGGPGPYEPWHWEYAG